MPPSLIADQITAKQLASDNHDCQSHDLNQNQLNDLELLLHGNYHPLDRYLNEQDYLSVLENFQLQD
ncbi:MAG: adenylyltransferase, partial [Verrucomicrobiota bacterium]|nr:adenylyltransferase [Verrucomicrobiota bacterium]